MDELSGARLSKNYKLVSGPDGFCFFHCLFLFLRFTVETSESKYQQFKELVDLVMKYNTKTTPASILMKISQDLNINFIEASKIRKIVADKSLHKKYDLQRPTLAYIVRDQYAHVGFLSSASGSSKISWDRMTEVLRDIFENKKGLTI